MRYREPARTYHSSLLLLAVLLVGLGIDLALGGGVAHLLGWLIAVVLVVGVDALLVYAARSLRSIVITDAMLTVGEQSVPLDSVQAAVTDPPPEWPILGRTMNNDRPRGTVAVGLRLAGAEPVSVATRHPEALIAAVGVGTAADEVRRPTDAELELLPEIDERAEAIFRVAGLALPRRPLAVTELRAAAAVFVVGDPVVGYAHVVEIDGCAHLQGLAVLPAHLRQGLGTRLLTAACDWARAAGHPAITLTTFSDVAWNGPYYAARGFRELAELTPGLAAERAHEAELGLDAVGRRIVMRRPLL